MLYGMFNKNRKNINKKNDYPKCNVILTRNSEARGVWRKDLSPGVASDGDFS